MFSLLFSFFTVLADPVRFDITGKQTQQSSTYANRFFSSKAVDGCKDPVMDNDCCTHTNPSEEPGWWTVNLGETVIVNSVTITNRVDHRKYVYTLALFCKKIITSSMRFSSNHTKEYET